MLDLETANVIKRRLGVRENLVSTKKMNMKHRQKDTERNTRGHCHTCFKIFFLNISEMQSQITMQKKKKIKDNYNY